MMSAKYFEYYTIILRGPFFRGHTVVVITLLYRPRPRSEYLILITVKQGLPYSTGLLDLAVSPGHSAAGSRSAILGSHVTSCGASDWLVICM